MSEMLVTGVTAAENAAVQLLNLATSVSREKKKKKHVRIQVFVLRQKRKGINPKCCQI